MKTDRYLPVILAVAAISVTLLVFARSASSSPILAKTAVANPQRLLALRRAKDPRTKSWIKRDIEPGVPLLYVSLITGISSGETNIYEQSGSTLLLVGQLSEGGGPIATDARGNVYVVESGSDILGEVPRNVYVYQPGATAPSLLLENPNYDSSAIAVSPSGRVYVAGSSLAVYAGNGSQVTGVMEYQLPSVIPAPSGSPSSVAGTQLPAVNVNPATPTGLAADSTGNLFAGWSPLNSSPCLYAGPFLGCGTELPASGAPWKEYLPVGQAANDIITGPVLARDDSQIIVAGGAGGSFEYLITLPKGSNLPSRVTSLPQTGARGVPGIISVAVSSAGRAIWAADGGVLSSVTPDIWKLEYPSGVVSLVFPIPQGSSPYSIAVPLNNALAEGPAYTP